MYILFLKKKYTCYADFHLIYFPSIPLRINCVYQLYAYHTGAIRILKNENPTRAYGLFCAYTHHRYSTETYHT